MTAKLSLAKRFSFDDAGIGMTKDGNKIDLRLASRPTGLTTRSWYKFAAELIKSLNEKMRIE